MAFISQVQGKGRQKASKSISIRKIKSGSCGGLVAADTGLRGSRIDIQIDEERRMIRIGEKEGGIFVSSKSGCFSCSIRVFRIIGKKKIPLEDGGDGWWYGRYAEIDNSTGEAGELAE